MTIAQDLLASRPKFSNENFQNLLNRESVYSVLSTNLTNSRRLIVRVFNDSSVIGQEMNGWLTAADSRRELEAMTSDGPIRSLGL